MVVGRAVGMDVHLDFCELAVCEEGKVGSARRVVSTPGALRVLAESLLATDRVVLVVTRSAWEIVGILEPHVAKVIVVSPGDIGITQARAKMRSRESTRPAHAEASDVRMVTDWQAAALTKKAGANVTPERA